MPVAFSSHPIQISQSQVITLGHYLSNSAALLIELSRLTTGLGGALRGDLAPLVYSRPAVLQPDGEPK